MADVDGEILKGHLDMIVLGALADAPLHGYAIIQQIKLRSGGVFDLPEGTIYPALHRLERREYLTSQWTTGETGRKRRIYRITRAGKRALTEHRALWQRFTQAVAGIFGEAIHASSRSNG